MGVMKRFAIWSMVLGAMAIAGGASALAFDGTGTTGTAPAPVSPVTAEEPGSEPVDVPAVAAPHNIAGWAAPHSFSFDPTPID